jgi:hypothetical protein
MTLPQGWNFQRLVPLGLAALIALIVIFHAVAWFIGRSVAIDTFEREAQAWRAAGHEVGWSKRDISGFPFRVTVSVADLMLRHNGVQGWQVEVPQSFVHVQPTSPSLILFELRGDVRWQTDAEAVMVIGHSGNRGSARLKSGRLWRADFTIEGPRWIEGHSGVLRMAADQAEWHIQQSAETDTTYRIYWAAKEPKWNDGALGGARLAQADLIIDQADALLEPGTLNRLAGWASAGGRLTVHGWQLDWEDGASLFLKGNMSANAVSGQWNGVLDLGADQPARVIEKLVRAGWLDTSAMVIGGFLFGSQTKIELPATIAEGDVLLLDQKIASLPPAF